MIARSPDFASFVVGVHAFVLFVLACSQPKVHVTPFTITPEYRLTSASVIARIVPREVKKLTYGSETRSQVCGYLVNASVLEVVTGPKSELVSFVSTRLMDVGDQSLVALKDVSKSLLEVVNDERVTEDNRKIIRCLSASNLHESGRVHLVKEEDRIWVDPTDSELVPRMLSVDAAVEQLEWPILRSAIEELLALKIHPHSRVP